MVKSFICVCVIVIGFIVLYTYRYHIKYYIKSGIGKLKFSKNIQKKINSKIVKRRLKDDEIKWYLNFIDEKLKEYGYKRKKEFKLDSYLKTRLEIAKTDEKVLKSVLDEILKYMDMGLDTRIITLVVNNRTYKSRNGIAGSYTENRRKIVVNIDEESSIDNVISILIHECTHHFLLTKNIKLEDTQKNEYLTDLTTVYLGFGKYMYKGYKDRGILKYTQEKAYQTIVYIHNDKVGYVGYDDIKYAQKYINKFLK